MGVLRSLHLAPFQVYVTLIVHFLIVIPSILLGLHGILIVWQIICHIMSIRARQGDTVASQQRCNEKEAIQLSAVLETS